MVSISIEAMICNANEMLVADFYSVQSLVQRDAFTVKIYTKKVTKGQTCCMF